MRGAGDRLRSSGVEKKPYRNSLRREKLTGTIGASDRSRSSGDEKKPHRNSLRREKLTGTIGASDSDGETPPVRSSLEIREIDTRESSQQKRELIIPKDIEHLFKDGEPVPLAKIDELRGGPDRPWGESFGLRNGYKPIVTLGPDTEVRTVFDPRVRELPADMQKTIDGKARTAKYNEKRYYLKSIATLPSVDGRPPVVVKYYGPSDWFTDSTLVPDYYGGRKTRTPKESAALFPGQTGANVLVVTKDGEYVISESMQKKGLPPHSVGVVAEGLSRSEDSRPEDGAPDLRRCALRALSDELGIPEGNVKKLEHIGMGTTRAGICDDLWVARTNLTIDKIRSLKEKAPEGFEHPVLHAVPSNPESLMDFFMKPYADGKLRILSSPAQAVLSAAVRSEHGEEGIRRIERRITDDYRRGLEKQLRATGFW